MMFNPWRIGAVLVIVLPAFALLLSILLLLPPPFSVACMLIGVAMFTIGAECGWQWPTLMGGTCMFGGVLAAAMMDALGPHGN